MCNPKISIIVPVYNTQEYLPKCLDTLINQTYSNLEIICVNDGSVDDSLALLNEYAEKDERIKVLSQENAGASVARNLGLSVATGDYVSFIDSDDWVYLSLYQSFVNALSKSPTQLDVWMFNVGSFVEGQNDVIQLKFFEASDWNNHISDDVVHKFTDCRRPFSRNLSAANKIYRKGLLDEFDIRFEEGLKYEDQYFCIKTFLNSKTIMFTDDIMYRYRNYHHTSVSCVVSDKAFDVFKIVDLIEEEIYKLNVYDNLKYAFFQYKYNVFSQHYNRCEPGLKQKYFDEMKYRLLVAEVQDLDPQITCQLFNYQMFLKIKNSSYEDFDNFMTQLQAYNKQS